MPSYQTRNPKAQFSPLRSVPLVRDVSVLGTGFLQQHNPLAFERQLAARALQLAQFTLEQAEKAYAASRTDLAELNRRRSKKRHDRDLTFDRIIKLRLSECFGTMNRRRGALVQARKAVLAAEAAVAKLAH